MSPVKDVEGFSKDDRNRIITQLREAVQHAMIGTAAVARADGPEDLRESLVALTACFTHVRAALARADNVILEQLGDLPEGKSADDRAMAIAVDRSGVDLAELAELGRRSRKQAEVAAAKAKFKK